MGCVCRCMLCDERGNIKQVDQFSFNASKKPVQTPPNPPQKLLPQILITSTTQTKPLVSPPSQRNYLLPIKEVDQTQFLSNILSYSENSISHFQSGFPASFDFSKQILLTGELMKYRPGISQQFVTRWCQLTHQDFSYFKNRYSAQCWLQRPLVVISLSKIVKARRVKFNTAQKPLKFSKSNNFYQFELFLKEEDEMLPVARKTELTPIKPQLVEKASALSPQQSVQNGKLMRRPMRSERSFNESPKNSPADRRSWTHREVEWFAAEKRLLFSAETAQDRDRWVKTINRLIDNEFLI